MLNKEKLNANAVGVAAHTDLQTKRYYLNCLNNHNSSNANTSRSNNKRSISTKLLVPRNGRRREKK